MLEACSLTKYYHHTAAVRGVSFQIRPGETLGCLGPNGAGKSTTVKMLIGLIEPSEGRILYQGRSIHDDLAGFQARLGYVPEEPHLYPHLSGREYLQLVGRLRGIGRRVLEPKIDEFLRLLGLWHDRHDPLSAYSKGMRQKILLSAALLHNPEILVLDEPFSGLDVTAALMLRRLLHALAEQGKIILYSSHVLEVVEKVCSQVVILRKGEVAAYDSIGRLRELLSQPSLEGVFGQLTEGEDSDALAGNILDLMKSGTTVPGASPPDTPEPPRAQAQEPDRRSVRELPGQFFEGLSKDFRYALRMLARSPGFTAVALLSVALGASVATCALSEMNGMVLRDVPGAAKPGELVALQMPVSYPDYQRYREQTSVLAATMAWLAPVPFAVSFERDTQRIWGQLVTPSYFSTLGVRPALGSFFSNEEDRPGQSPAAVVSYRFWQTRLGSSPLAVGKALRINSQTVTIAGLGPPRFLGASPMLYPADLWMPLQAGARFAPELAGNALEHRERALLQFTGRLQPGVTMMRAEAALDTVARKIAQDYGDPDRDRPGRRVTLVDGGKLFPFRKQDKPFFTSFFLVLAALMILIPCANVANMMLARAASRRREVAIRLSLGASRGRLIRQLLMESMLIASAAGALGFVVSVWLMSALARVTMPFATPVGYDFRPDGRVLLFVLALMLFGGVALGLAPALAATRTDLVPALKETSGVLLPKHRGFKLRHLLVVSQLAGTLVLLTVLGLESFGIQTRLGVQQGFDLKNLSLVSIDPVRDGYPSEQAPAFFDKLLDRVKALPSVSAASLTASVPVSMPGAPLRVYQPRAANPRPVATVLKHVVGRDYLATTGIPILLGRNFRREDESADAGNVVVSEALARAFWGGVDPLGRTIEITGNQAAPGGVPVLPRAIGDRPGALERGRRVFEVVGIARDVAEGLTVQKPRPTVYFPLTPADYRHAAPEGITLIVRAEAGFDLLAAVRRESSALDPRVTPFNARSMTEQIDRFMAPLDAASWTYNSLWICGLILASVGLAGTTAYSVSDRRREIGIRVALGARACNVLTLVMKEGGILIALGLILGLAGAWAAVRMLAAMNASVGQVTSTSTSNPTVLFGAPLLLAALALIACYLPARRALRIDPAVTLRQE
jgi:predicted permease